METKTPLCDKHFGVSGNKQVRGFREDLDFARDLETRLQAAEQARKEAEERERVLRAEVKEWVCEACNFVYPGPPQAGIWCVICPRCSGSTMPKATYERKRAEARADQATREIAGLREALRKYGAHDGCCPHHGGHTPYPCNCGLDAALAQPTGDAAEGHAADCALYLEPDKGKPCDCGYAAKMLAAPQEKPAALAAEPVAMLCERCGKLKPMAYAGLREPDFCKCAALKSSHTTQAQQRESDG